MNTQMVTVGDAAARLARMMRTLGGDNQLMFAAETYEQLQQHAKTPLPHALIDLLDTAAMLAQEAQHDREAMRRERDACLAACERWENSNSRLLELCQAQGKLIDRLNEPGV